VKKIPSLFVRDFAGNPKLVLPQLTPGCEWVLAGEGGATRKRDGTACMVDDQGRLWRRYDAKQGKQPPEGFLPAQPEADPVTGHWPGWLLVGDSPQDKWYHDAPWPTVPGTYELCGPKFQTNAEGLEKHVFFKHGEEHLGGFRYAQELAGHSPGWLLVGGASSYAQAAPFHPDYIQGVFDGCRLLFRDLLVEGIVWHHPDGRMAKLKRSDFGYPWPLSKEAPK
jgi:hypothetical protein